MSTSELVWILPVMAAVGVIGAVGFATIGRLTSFSAVRLPLVGRIVCAAVWLVGWLWLPMIVWTGAYKFQQGPDCRARNVSGCFQPAAAQVPSA